MRIMKQSSSKETETTKSQAGGTNTTDGEDKNSKASNKASENAEPPLLEKFFNDQLQDIYYAEQQLIKAIPKMSKAATTEQLQEAFDDHLHQTQKHVKRLEKVFSLIGKKAEGKKCEAIEGIIKEAESIISDTEEGTMTRDAALIMAAQKVEHYEIATYGGLVQLALTLDLQDVSELLDQTLMEEEDTDQLLTDIAESHINIDAEKEGNNYSWKKEETNEKETVGV